MTESKDLDLTPPAGWPVCTCGQLGLLEEGYFICRTEGCPGYWQVLRAATPAEQASACGVPGCGLWASHPVHERPDWATKG